MQSKMFVSIYMSNILCTYMCIYSSAFINKCNLMHSFIIVKWKGLDNVCICNSSFHSDLCLHVSAVAVQIWHWQLSLLQLISKKQAAMHAGKQCALSNQWDSLLLSSDTSEQELSQCLSCCIVSWNKLSSYPCPAHLSPPIHCVKPHPTPPHSFSPLDEN